MHHCAKELYSRKHDDSRAGILAGSANLLPTNTFAAMELTLTLDQSCGACVPVDGEVSASVDRSGSVFNVGHESSAADACGTTSPLPASPQRMQF